jgi:hypothetical protein
MTPVLGFLRRMHTSNPAHFIGIDELIVVPVPVPDAD